MEGEASQSCPAPYMSAHVFTAEESSGALVVETVATNVARIEMETSDGLVVPSVILRMELGSWHRFNAYAIDVPAGYGHLPRVDQATGRSGGDASGEGAGSAHLASAVTTGRSTVDTHSATS